LGKSVILGPAQNARQVVRHKAALTHKAQHPIQRWDPGRECVED
jgi:hypothetical protein